MSNLYDIRTSPRTLCAGPRSPSGIADPFGGFCLPQGLLRRFWGVWLCFRKNVLLRRHWEAEAADRRVLQAFLGVHPKRNSFSKLLVAHTSFHSACTLSRPRKLKRRKPRCSLIWPKTGSTMALRIL